MGQTVTKYPASYSTSGSISGTKYQSAIGKGSSTTATGNDYCQSSGSTATITYAFDFSDIPASAAIESVAVKVGGHLEDASQSTATLQLYSGSAKKGAESKFTSTSKQVVTMDAGTWTREELQSAKLVFTIGYYGGLVNGADFTVTYGDGVTHTVTVEVGSGVTTDRQASEEVAEGGSYSVSIYGAVSSITDNGADVSAALVERQPESGGSVAANPGSYSVGGTSIKGTNYKNCIGKGSSNTASGNDYANGSSGSTSTITYSFDLSAIPSNATIDSVSVKVGGHCENTSKSTATLQLYSGDTAKGDQGKFTSTSKQVVTLSAGTWTRSELQEAKLVFTIGYYGGLVNGVDFEVAYSVPGSGETYRVYTIASVMEAHSILINLGDTGARLRVRVGGEWKTVRKIYRKQSGKWSETDESALTAQHYRMM